LGIREPFPWPTLDEGVAAAKAEYSGRGSFAARREFFGQRAERVNELLRTRIADHAAGNVAAAVADLRNRAGDAHALANPPTGLDLRHGRLAVRTAIAWSAFMLD